MTIIVYKDGVLASDSQVNLGTKRWGQAEKMARAEDGTLGAGCGAFAEIHRFLEYVRAGAKGEFRPVEKEFSGLLVRPDGTLWRVEPTGSFPLTSKEVAMGSGEMIALGALWMKATAIQAVQAAMEHEGSCGGEVQTLTLNPVVVRIAA